MRDSDLSSGRGGSDPGAVLPKISIMSLGNDAAIMGTNDARTTGDSRSAAGSSDVHGAAISVSSLSQDHQSESSKRKKSSSGHQPTIRVVEMGVEDADAGREEEKGSAAASRQ